MFDGCVIWQELEQLWQNDIQSSFIAELDSLHGPVMDFSWRGGYAAFLGWRLPLLTSGTVISRPAPGEVEAVRAVCRYPR